MFHIDNDLPYTLYMADCEGYFDTKRAHSSDGRLDRIIRNIQLGLLKPDRADILRSFKIDLNDYDEETRARFEQAIAEKQKH